MNLRRLLLLALVAICALNLAGCAAMDANGLPMGDGWHAKLEHAPLPVTWVQVPQGMITTFCPHLPRVNACAWRDYTNHECVVYAETSEADTPQWLRTHEYEHCAGRDHD